MESKTALLLIDIQLDYFEGGAFPLDPVQRERALDTAARLLGAARATGSTVIHVRHESPLPMASLLARGTPGTRIHPRLEPIEGELVVTKAHPDSFRETELERILRDRGIEHLVVGGMIAWMCVQSTVRSAYDLGFQVHLVPDMVASRGFTSRGLSLDADSTLAASLYPLFWRFARETSPQEAEILLR
ncbi:MAG TPA: cysteine hydrolase family protein [Fibrobacteria bacterium]|nr:cysteine hydrolase family protein [Fibrobacteria bacterium]HOX50196.1 cysteine hydrolase family protein [Fibrobacteria bacterium]